MHFFNPPVIMKLIEVVSGYDTDGDTIKGLWIFQNHLEKPRLWLRIFPVYFKQGSDGINQGGNYIT
ncbi:3-hydroxyacyl-CoA dehydrogenase NAD-binding domain-containing protein [Acidiplasma cupricumulans]|uniref:3-hydroxyacyl-CoA dehydrogenase NAD-binding domain-containing protein n=1 Tax=Acidiplasma cupricumulans TaxID=312540 RepID=UPI000781BDE2|nr:3-hydroxyacyl-CoA dehydrogenase NAD-binding domain-containing protein [Acidiplasma cupricumulans]